MISDVPPVVVVEEKKEYEPYQVFKGEGAKEKAVAYQKEHGGFISTDLEKYMVLYIPKVAK